MPVKAFRPTTPSRRFITQADYSELTKNTSPEKSLLEPKKSTGGRNNYGRVTSRFRGGAHKRNYRLIDFRRDKREIPATIHSIEYDPNRSANIALLHYADGEKRYIVCPEGVKTGTAVIASPTADIQPGNALPLKNIPAGTSVHNLEAKINGGGKLVRSAGTAAQIVGFEKGHAQIRMPSGEIRVINESCWATVGQVGNLEHENIVWGNAGRMRRLGFRPHNRGVSMNPVDHPLGGGEGRSSGGRHPVSPWGWKTKGKKTRNSKRTDSFIMQRRK